MVVNTDPNNVIVIIIAEPDNINFVCDFVFILQYFPIWYIFLFFWAKKALTKTIRL